MKIGNTDIRRHSKSTAWSSDIFVINFCKLSESSEFLWTFLFSTINLKQCRAVISLYNNKYFSSWLKKNVLQRTKSLSHKWLWHMLWEYSINSCQREYIFAEFFHLDKVFNFSSFYILSYKQLFTITHNLIILFSLHSRLSRSW